MPAPLLSRLGPRCGLEARAIFVEHVAEALGSDPAAAVSPDVGGAKRAERFREALADRLGRPVARGLVEKYRSEGVVSGDILAGDVTDRTVILFDDMISSGGTIARAARTCRDSGARAVWAVASHGVFTPDADEALAEGAVDRIVTLDTIPPDRIRSEAVRSKLTQLDASGLFAQAILTIHSGGQATPA